MINVKMPRKRCFRGIFVGKSFPALWAGKETMLFWWILWEEALERPEATARHFNT